MLISAVMPQIQIILLNRVKYAMLCIACFFLVLHKILKIIIKNSGIIIIIFFLLI